jgi:hypothetical protein
MNSCGGQRQTIWLQSSVESGKSAVDQVSRTVGIVGRSTLRVDGPDFQEQAAVQTGVAFGDLRGFVEVGSENEPVAADHFLGFAKRTVCYHILPHDRFAFISEPVPGLYFSLINQPIIPSVELVDCVLYFIPREGSVPLAAGNYQVFGSGSCFAHGSFVFQVSLEPGSGPLSPDHLVRKNHAL